MGLQPLLLCSALPWIDEATSGLGSFQISFGVSTRPAAVLLDELDALLTRPRKPI